MAAAAIATLLAVPLVSVVSSLAHPAVEVWRHLWQTQLVELTVNTLALLLGVGAGTLVLGSALAWLVVAYKFPGRLIFEWALILPLAMPAYVIGFAFLGLLDYAGPVHTALRGWLGTDTMLPDVRTYPGVLEPGMWATVGHRLSPRTIDNFADVLKTNAPPWEMARSLTIDGGPGDQTGASPPATRPDN